jgi:hypothetical protein
MSWPMHSVWSGQILNGGALSRTRLSEILIFIDSFIHSFIRQYKTRIFSLKIEQSRRPCFQSPENLSNTFTANQHITWFRLFKIHIVLNQFVSSDSCENIWSRRCVLQLSALVWRCQTECRFTCSCNVVHLGHCMSLSYLRGKQDNRSRCSFVKSFLKTWNHTQGMYIIRSPILQTLYFPEFVHWAFSFYIFHLIIILFSTPSASLLYPEHVADVQNFSPRGNSGQRLGRKIPHLDFIAMFSALQKE